VKESASPTIRRIYNLLQRRGGFTALGFGLQQTSKAQKLLEEKWQNQWS
jgi:hypothetical protein